ncbi:hypothetical protein MTBPR1_120071 [Candidatus Terasakiella magnetica]|uniref:Uncharacterized protein n=1 Tax=Candidatus Terasakiella magnetica TaxID=1867952 RepID=A0A1C3RES9_9PROT|nr:hypothetical protein [Candidatus Terasakiella magnetica]SCA55765.1 hypothetical protein MTBPR1_120071 [Candidatus Terasakiella magnetica]
MSIPGIGAYGVGMMQNLQQQTASAAQVKMAVETNTQVAEMMSGQATEQAKVAATQATSAHKIDILA